MHRAIPVSADRAAPAGPTHPREKPASRRGRAKSRETRTLHWRGTDSNLRLGALARLAAEVLTEQLGDIGLVIDNQDADAHALLPAA